MEEKTRNLATIVFPRGCCPTNLAKTNRYAEQKLERGSSPDSDVLTRVTPFKAIPQTLQYIA